ncbi:MAG TPA: leucine--tRNA ligase, partial [Nitrospiraceae bacterium]|nr:leucine--tRNA ligase [Nitrospiraceae bacterium]
ALMEMVNEAYDYSANEGGEAKLPVLRFAIETLLLLIAPFAPHVAEELWEAIGGTASIANMPWPEYDPEAIKTVQLMVVVQVNGKVRNKLTLPAGASKKEIETAALTDPKIREHTKGKEPKKVIVVQGKLVNIVV